MGRNRKNGLDYFPFDIDLFQDIKIRKLIKYQSGKAITVYALLLCFIYKDGYYMRWDKELPFIISEQTGFEEAYVLEVINSCLKLGLFSNELYVSDGILTSKGIQERYKKVCDLCKRKIKMEEFSLISSEETVISSEEIPISSEEMPINSEKSTQSKVKKSKVKKSKVNSSIPPTPPKGDVQPPKAKKGKEKKDASLNAKAREVFESHYKATFDADYYWTAKDAGNMSKLLDKLKFQRGQRNLPVDDEAVLNALGAFLKTIDEGWIFEHFSVANINSMFNELRTNAISKRNGNSNKTIGTPSAGSDEDFMRNIAEGIARGHYERQQRGDDH